LLTDVPTRVEQLVTMMVAKQGDGEPVVETIADLAAVRANLVRAALDQRLTDVDLPCSPWTSVAATLTNPHAVSHLAESLEPSDAPKLSRLTQRLGGPGRDVCVMLARAVESAASED
jgi:hypothetical protein